MKTLAAIARALRSRAFFSAGVSLAAALGGGGCSTTGSNGTRSVPTVPAWRVSPDARTFSMLEVRLACHQLAPGAKIETTDAVFVPLSHAWLEEAAAWSWHFTRAIGFTWTAESGDCDKFAAGFALAANVAASRVGVRAQPLLARIFVAQHTAFGGVPAGGGHALNAFLSERGLFVFEPQSRKLVPLAEYPNRNAIIEIRIGG